MKATKHEGSAPEMEPNVRRETPSPSNRAYEMSRPKTVISGSYRKHLGGIYELKTFLEAKGIEVLSPVGSGALNPGDEFVILDADPFHDPRTLQDSVFAKLRASSFQVVYNQGGYLGMAAILEMGYSIAQGIQIFTVEPVADPNLRPYTRLLSEIYPDSRQFIEL